MSNFQDILEEEVEKSVDDSAKGDGKEENEIKKAKSKIGLKLNFNFSITRFFSFKVFLKSFLLFFLLLLAAFSWTYFNANKTIEDFKSKLASKTVLIEKNADNESFYSGSSIDNHDWSFQDTTDNKVEGANPVVTTGDAIATISTDINSTGALTPAPVPDLYESMQEGLIPKARLSDGMTPFNAYKKPFVPVTNKPKISFVAVGVGMSRKQTEQMISDLPPEISLGFSPYAPDIKLLSDAARTAGHETWLMLPLQNESYPLNDPGPATLFVTASIEQNQARLLSIMGRATGYVGFISWEDHIYTAKDVETSSYIQQIFGRGLGVIDSAVSSTKDFGRRIAYNNEFPFVKNNFWLDKNLKKGEMQINLKHLEDLATARGQAIMLFHPYPKSIYAIKTWIKSPASANFELAPASYLAEYRDE